MLSLHLFAAAALLQAGAIDVKEVRPDSTLILAPGDTVRIFSSLVHDGGLRGGRRLDVLYGTRVPASNTAARAEQADRAALVFGPHAIALGVRSLSIGICDTQACVQRVHPPSAWFLYERSAQGWRRVK